MNDDERAVEFQALIDEHLALQAEFRSIQGIWSVEAHAAFLARLRNHLNHLQQFIRALESDQL